MGCAASTETGIDPGRPYELHPDVSLRPEPFGALAYHYGRRSLTFLRSEQLARLVVELGAHASVTSSMDALAVAEEHRPSLLAALSRLAAGDVVRCRDSAATPGDEGAL